MKIQVEQNENCEALLTVEVDPATVESAMKKAARRLSEKKSLPGFRKGKAPYSVVLQTWGEEAILDEALDALGPEVYRKALEDKELEPSAVGTMKRIISREPLTLEFLVPVQPVVDLGDYRSVRIPFEEPSISDEDTEKAMEELRQEQSILEPVSRPAQKGDVLSADIVSEILSEDGKVEPLAFEGVENPQEVDLDDNLGGLYPGAGDGLVGITEGETRTVTIRYPDTFPLDRLRNLNVQLTVKCLGVKIRQVPEWSEELVQSFSVFSTVEELRQEVHGRLKQQSVEAQAEKYADSVIEKMVENAKIVFPPALLEEELDDEIQTLGRRMQQQKVSLEVYLKTVPDGMAGLRKKLEPDARRKLVRRLLLTELVKHESLTVSEKEVDAQMARYRSMFGDDRTAKSKNKKAIEDTLRQLATNDVLSRMIVKRVVEIGRGKAPEPAAAEPSTNDGGE
jgi:trigger factor